MSPPSEPDFAVVWPRARATQQEFAREHDLRTLDGKTVAFIWDYVFRGDEMFRILDREIRERARDVKFVGPDQFGDIHGPDERQVMSTLGDRLRQYAADAAIVGVGA